MVSAIPSVRPPPPAPKNRVLPLSFVALNLFLFSRFEPFSAHHCRQAEAGYQASLAQKFPSLGTAEKGSFVFTLPENTRISGSLALDGNTIRVDLEYQGNRAPPAAFPLDLWTLRECWFSLTSIQPRSMGESTNLNWQRVPNSEDRYITHYHYQDSDQLPYSPSAPPTRELVRMFARAQCVIHNAHGELLPPHEELLALQQQATLAGTTVPPCMQVEPGKTWVATLKAAPLAVDKKLPIR